jgi:hypothetical protein
MDEKNTEVKKQEVKEVTNPQTFRLVRDELQAVIIANSQDEARKKFDELLKKLNQLNNA